MITHPAQEFAIHTQGLTRSYGKIEALVDLDLSVPYGSIFGYLGRNGAGKTTTIRLLTGLARPTRGEAWIAGISTSNNNQAASQMIGFLPQEPGLYGWMKGQEFLSYIGSLFSLSPREIKKRAAQVLELTSLAQDAGRRIQGYSGGMKQRLAIAQALMGNPSILILDEPTSSLDPAGRQEILATLAGMRGEVTVFLSSHILGDIERVCDTVAVLHKGRLVLVSSREELLMNYPVNAVALLLAASSTPAPQDFIEELENSAWVERVNVSGPNLMVLARDVPQGKEKLLPMIVKHGLQVEKYEWVRPSLEEIFLELSQ